MPAGYRMYAATPADFVGSGQVGAPLVITPGTLTVWDARTGGTQITDLLDASELPVVQVATDSFGNFRFWAPDTYGTLWVTAGTAQRYAVQPAIIGDLVTALLAQVTALQAAVDSAGLTSLKATVDSHGEVIAGLPTSYVKTHNGQDITAVRVGGPEPYYTEAELPTLVLVFHNKPAPTP